MKRLFFVLGLLCLCSGNVLAADPLLLSDSEMQKLHTYFPAEDENAPLVWKGDPLSITLPVNVEKRVIFSEPIEANLNANLTSDQLRIINNEQSLYLTALKPFSATRLYVTLKSSNKIILMDISTSDKATNTTRTVQLSSSNTSSSTTLHATTTTNSALMASSPMPMGSKTSLNSGDTNTQSNSVGSADIYVDSIRFAWQQLYAPQRLLNSSNNMVFTRTPMHTQQWVSDLVYGDKVLAHPQISWLAGDVYVTALELRNKYAHSTTLDLRHDLCGEWQAATLYPRSQLKPAGQKSGDSTTLFLISTKPFGQVLEDCHGGA